MSDYSDWVADRRQQGIACDLTESGQAVLPLSTRALICIASAITCWVLVIGAVQLVWRLAEGLFQLL